MSMTYMIGGIKKMSKYIKYLSDRVSSEDAYRIEHMADAALHGGIKSKIEIRDESTGELVWEPLHNKTVISGGILLAQKLFNLDRSVLLLTPTYDDELDLDNKVSSAAYPSVVITDDDNNVIGSISDESQRKICGFMVGQNGCGSDISDVFEVSYASRIEPDDIVPFRYPLESEDTVDEEYYKMKKTISLPSGSVHVAYYSKLFSNSPSFTGNYVSSLGTYNDSITPSTIYTDKSNADKAQIIVESHLKLSETDAREYFITHTGIQSAKINQLSLLTAWERDIEVTKPDESGNTLTKTVSQLCQVRPFSVLNIPNEALNADKSLSIIYTLYF